MNVLIEWMNNLISNIGQGLVSVLPVSPFKSFIDGFNAPDYIGYLNWFFPVRELMAVVVVWLAAISLFYIYSVIMRWVKMIGD